MQVQPLQPQGNISGVATASSTPLNVAPAPSQGQITSVGELGQAPTPVSQSSSSGLGSQIATKLEQARQQYPNSDGAILNAFIRDNQTTLPTTVKKIQGLMSTDRASRDNNPTAMTTDVAQQLGLKPGIDFTDGTSFQSGGHTLYNAQLIGDPIQTTVKAFDNAASQNIPIFTTASGSPRWSYINMTNQQWQALTPQQKADTIATMKTKGEGGKGYSPTQILDSLIKDNPPQNTQNTQPQTYPNSDIPLSTPPGTAALEQTGEFIKNNTVGALGNILKPFATGLASGIRSIQATPQILSGNAQGAAETMAKPILGIPTMQGQTPVQNIGSALSAGSNLIGLGSTLPAITGNAITQAGVSGGLQGLLSGEGGYLSSNQPHTLAGGLISGLQGAATGAATGAGAATVAPAMTGQSSLADLFKNKQDSILSEKTWQMVKDPSLEANTNKTTLTGTEASVEPTTTHDQQLIEAAKPYVTDDPITTKNNLQNGVATQSQELQDGLVGKGGTWSENTLQGVLNDTKVPLALKNTAEMTVVKNINNYVMELANDPEFGITRDASGSLALSKQFRQQISTEYGENIWNKDTPAAQYIRNVNQALNGLTESRLPDGSLPDGTPFKDAMRQISLLSEARDNVQIPKEGKQTSTNLLGKGLTVAKPFINKVLPYATGGLITKELP